MYWQHFTFPASRLVYMKVYNLLLLSRLEVMHNTKTKTKNVGRYEKVTSCFS